MTLLSYLAKRLLTIPVTLLIITATLFAITLVASPTERASLYFPPRTPSYLTEEQLARITDQIVARYGLDDPYWQQYGRWVGNLLQGEWGWSPTYNQDVLALLKRRLPATVELTLFTLLAVIPLALTAGVGAGWRGDGWFDRLFRATAFVGTAVPPFILGMVLLSIFYVGVRWFPPGRTDMLDVMSGVTAFNAYTGLLTVDGLLNGRLDVTLDALRHLVLPVTTAGLLHWATVGLVTRTAVTEERSADYIVAARARGLPPRRIVWRHAFRNAMLPALASGALSAASLISGVFVVEVIFNIKGLSEIVVRSMETTPDAPLALGLAVVSVLLVLPIMLLFDLLRVAADPRVREEVGL